MSFSRALFWFFASFFGVFALLVGLLVFASYRLGHLPKEDPSAGRHVYTQQDWDRIPDPAPVPRARAEKAPSEPATVREARQWSRCHGPACYHDVRGEARGFLPLAQ